MRTQYYVPCIYGIWEPIITGMVTQVLNTVIPCRVPKHRQSQRLLHHHRTARRRLVHHVADVPVVDVMFGGQVETFDKLLGLCFREAP